MHIALDLRMVGPQLHGIARYALELARRLPLLAPESRFALLVSPRFDPSLVGPRHPNVHLVHAHSRFLSVAEQAELPLLLKRLAPDLYHSPSFSVPIAYRGPLALTIHDANHLAFPEHYGRFHGLYYQHVLRPGALRARLVLTVSKFAQEEIEQRLRLPPGIVQRVYNGVGSAFRPRPQGELEQFRRRRGLPERFVLFVGNTKPHKNVGQLIDAFAKLGDDLALVLCVGPKADHLLKGAAPAVARRIHVFTPRSDDDLPLLYGAARIFAFPSLYEGFGLPPLEAMACGTPVVTVRAAALPEVVGDAAELVEPGDVEGLAQAIRRVDGDPTRSAELRARGIERAALFDWDQTARTVLASYRTAAEPFQVRHASVIPGPRGPRLKVLFCVRSNLGSLIGGDATQTLRTKAALEELGLEIALWSKPQPPTHGSYDLAHLFHLTRLDTFVHAQSLDRAGMPFVLSTIFWPTDELERRGYVGALRLLHGALATGRAEAAKNGVRAVLAEDDWRWAMLPEALLPIEQRVDFLIRHARRLLPNSQAEADVLHTMGGIHITPVVNASDPPPPVPAPPTASLPERFILCAGRIEPRKNQLALVEAMRRVPLPLVLIGDPGPMHRAYYDRVRRAAGASTLLLRARPRDELFGFYAAAQAHVAPAWYETPGLVSLEAAAAGTRVVTTDRGSTREYFGEEASYLNPADPVTMVNAIEHALSRPKSAALQERVLREFTWRKAGEQTAEAYQAALGTQSDAPAPSKAAVR